MRRRYQNDRYELNATGWKPHVAGPSYILRYVMCQEYCSKTRLRLVGVF